MKQPSGEWLRNARGAKPLWKLVPSVARTNLTLFFVGDTKKTFVGISEKLISKNEEEIKKKMHDLKVFHKVRVGREFKMAEMKKKIKENIKEKS